MKNKGFTLIELLAVIVILAIIALIATPIVLGIIEDSRDSSREISAGYVVSAVEYAYNSAYAKNQGAVPKLYAGENETSVKAEFDMSGAVWGPATLDGKVVAENTIVTSDGVTCTVQFEDESTKNSFRVSCGTDKKSDVAVSEYMSVTPETAAS